MMFGDLVFVDLSFGEVPFGESSFGARPLSTWLLGPSPDSASPVGAPLGAPIEHHSSALVLTTFLPR